MISLKQFAKLLGEKFNNSEYDQVHKMSRTEFVFRDGLRVAIRTASNGLEVETSILMADENGGISETPYPGLTHVYVATNNNERELIRGIRDDIENLHTCLKEYEFLKVLGD